ncbi:hypothetical protein NA56DRAFT_585704 [Hyaloscypha hepaticicola]|uniref:Uncharacterized protein n=1 Tax=Hyaloscypha hepaticicola TaxID=2082293 RepID=A0A2J6PH55_9HELO|nr:hypothetical protein NA56DRAFT_585704 [Hyaloscypha hepaticicola]
MDPDAIAAKEKWVARKSRPSKKPEDFQQILAKNPYARALATPLRRCQLTNNALPSFFLQGFNLMAHPETGIPWYVPRSLALAKKGEPQLQLNKTPAAFTSALGYTVYILASQHILRAMQDPKGYGMKQKNKMRNMAQRRGISTSKFLSAAGWREDMHEFILRIMRRRIVENLVALTNLKRGYVVGCSGWEDALAKPQIGTFLWTGGAGEMEEGTDSPPEFATLDITIGRKEESKTKKIPVHNLRRLLGKDKLAELRETLPSGIFERNVVVLKHKQQAVDVEMQLWRLQGFLAEYRDLYRDLEELPTNEEDADQDDYYEDGNE